MADNIKILDSTGTVQDIATDKVAGVDYQRTKSVWGADGTVNDTSEAKPLPVQLTANALSEGSTSYLNLAIDENPASIKASGGILYMILAQNEDATDAAFLHIYDESSVTVGSTTPKHTIKVKADSSERLEFRIGEKYANAIRIAVTKGSTGAVPPTTPLIINAEFK